MNFMLHDGFNGWVQVASGLGLGLGSARKRSRFY